MGTSRSRRSSLSVTSQKIKESQVKLRLATSAREMQYKRSRNEELQRRLDRKLKKNLKERKMH